MTARFGPYPLVGFAAGFLMLVAACGANPAPTTQVAGISGLASEGVALAVIGDPPRAAIDQLTDQFGAPDEDSGWIPAGSTLYGPCPGALLRAVGWGSLYLFFIADEEVTPENEHLVARLLTYSYGYDFSRNEGASDPRELRLTTAEGIGLGATRAQVRQSYGARLSETHDEGADTWEWSVDDGSASHLIGLFSGPDEAATVELIERVPGCGPAAG